MSMIPAHTHALVKVLLYCEQIYGRLPCPPSGASPYYRLIGAVHLFAKIALTKKEVARDAAIIRAVAYALVPRGDLNIAYLQAVRAHSAGGLSVLHVLWGSPACANLPNSLFLRPMQAMSTRSLWDRKTSGRE